MPRRSWSVARLMSGIAILAVGLAPLQVLRPRETMTDPLWSALVLVLGLVLTVAADRALFGQRHRAFWVGFTATGWLCAAAALTYHPYVRNSIFRYGPPFFRAHEIHMEFLRAAEVARLHGTNLALPRVSEWYLLLSAIAEAGLAVALGILVASVGGLYAALMALAARWARAADKPTLPGSDIGP